MIAERDGRAKRTLCPASDTATGLYGYQLVLDWEQLPGRFSHPDVSDVSTDAQNRVCRITRLDPRVFVYEEDGTFVIECEAAA
jgi:hypothetical protein